MKEYGFLVWNEYNEKVLVHIMAETAEAAKWSIESARMEAGLRGTVTKAMYMGIRVRR